MIGLCVQVDIGRIGNDNRSKPKVELQAFSIEARRCHPIRALVRIIIPFHHRVSIQHLLND